MTENITVIKKVKKRIIKKKNEDKLENTDDKVKKTNEINNELTLEERYILTLTNEEKETLQIAKEHLKSSFNMKKSVGFSKYKINNIL